MTVALITAGTGTRGAFEATLALDTVNDAASALPCALGYGPSGV